MAVQINERFSCERDRNTWILIERRKGVNRKTGEATVNQHRTYPGKLTQLYQTVIDKTLGEDTEGVSTEFTELMNRLEQVESDINKSILAMMKHGVLRKTD